MTNTSHFFEESNIPSADVVDYQVRNTILTQS